MKSFAKVGEMIKKYYLNLTMKKPIILLSLIFSLSVFTSQAQQNEMLIYHPIQTDKAGNIIPWYTPDQAIAFDHLELLVQYAPRPQRPALLHGSPGF